MNTKQAVEYVMKTQNLTAYSVATAVGAPAVSGYQWLKTTKMSQHYRDKFFEVFKVRVVE